MTKLQIVSDLHLEFATIEIDNAGADLLILAGDICVADYFNKGEASPKHYKAQQFVTFFETTCAKFPQVLYVMGNHEHYQGRFNQTYMTLKNRLGHITNLHILNNETFHLDGYCFFGTTLWTNFNENMMGAKLAVQQALNDYHLIQNDRYEKLRPDDTLDYFNNAINIINNLPYNKIIIVGHHAPSYQSITPEFRNAGHINYGYYSDLERFIADRPQIKLWIHGHVHSSHDYMIQNTRIVANPRGYSRVSGVNENAQFNSNKVYEV